MIHTKPWMSATLKTAVLNASVLFQKNLWHLLVLCCRKNRTITPEGWLYTVSHTKEQQEKVNTFVDALKVGGINLLEFLNA